MSPFPEPSALEGENGILGDPRPLKNVSSAVVTTPWSEIAWNGVRFLAPASWEPAGIGPRYLMLAEQGEPALEVKWEQIAGRFSPERHLERLSALHKIKVQPSPLSKEWRDILAPFAATGFAWQTGAAKGAGVVLYCPVCNRATLIQFLGGLADPSRGVSLPLLNSFRDHDLDDRVRWAIFDVRAEMPKEYRLVRHCFEPGRFEMHFASKGRRQVRLYRWGPAAAILANEDLAAFAAKKMGADPGLFQRRTWMGHDAVQWEKPIPELLWTRWRERMRGVSSFQWFRLWHIVEKNRLLAVAAEGGKTIHTDRLERICAEYESF